MSNCSKCNSVCNSDDCGCTPVGLTTPNYCITDTPVCPLPEPCSEITDANCLIYTGPDILCQGLPIISQNDSISSAFVALATLACATASGGVSQIIAGTNIVISPISGLGVVTINADCCDVYFADILGDAYSNLNLAGHLNLKQDILTAGPGISIVGTTISAVGGLGTVTNVSTVFTQVGSSPSLSVANPTSTPVITLNLPLASASNSSGLLSSADWTTFNNKQKPLTLSTNGTTGAATLTQFVSTTNINIPIYQGQLTLATTGSGAATLIGNLLTIPTNSFNLGVTDGTNTVNNVNTIQFIGATITGISPTGIVTLSAASAYNRIQKAGVNVTQRAVVNFIGTSVLSIADNSLSSPTRTDVTIQAYNTIQGNSVLITQSDTVNFAGAGVTVTGNSLLTTVTIPGAAIYVNRNVYVMQNGSDITGMAQRLDLPFATIAAATAAALNISPAPTETNRIKIVVETGVYTETIVIYDFIDYDLQDSTIIAPPSPSIAPCIIDKGSAYALPTNGRYTSMIYGNATFISGANQTCLSITSIYSQNISLYIKCNHINNIVPQYFIGSAMKINTGKVTIDAQYIYSANTETALGVIQLGTDTGYNIASIPYPPKVEISNAKIFNNQDILTNPLAATAVNSVINVINNVLAPSGGNLSAAYPVKLMLKNCEVGGFQSGTLGTIGVDAGGGGALDLTLKDTSIYVRLYLTLRSIQQASSAAINVIKVWCQGAYSNALDNTTALPGPVTSVPQIYSVDANLQFNQGIKIS